MTDLDKAREWAKLNIDGGYFRPGNRALDAAEIIQSLPDQWVDVEKVREAISGQLSVYTRGTVSHYIAEEITRNLEVLLPPKLPTLADMTQEERKACKGMQADSDHFGRVAINCVLDDAVQVMDSNGWVATVREKEVGYKCITPLPDLPKLQWPAQEPRNPETPPAETLNNTSSDTPRNPRPEGCCGKCPETADQQPNTSETPKSSIKPSEVPPNEPWLIEAADEKAIGTRFAGNTVAPWSVAALDGSFAGDYNDREVTLIHKLVPEPPALPEGMRLADHEEYGRVVTSPWGDGDDDYKIFFLNEDVRAGADYEYAHESRLTFLDGDQHV